MARRCALGCLLPVLLLAAREAQATRDRPPTAHTGGFGEPTCHVCHFESAVNGGAGRVVLAGLPPRYTPGALYALTVLVTQPQLGAAGFQLTARFTDGRQAGLLRIAAGEETRADITVDGGVQYAHHLYDGTTPVAADTARWRLLWQAPLEGGVVDFHAAGNAANDDSSPLGDAIYTASARLSAGK